MPLGTPLLPPLRFQLPPEESPLSPAGSLCPFRTIIPLICTNKPESRSTRERERGWQTHHQVGSKQGRSGQCPSTFSRKGCHSRHRSQHPACG